MATFAQIDKNKLKKDYLSGIKPAALADKYEIPESSIYNWIARNDLTNKKEKLEQKTEDAISNDIQDKIKKSSDKVVDKLLSIIENSTNESNIIKACDSILNISGLKKQTLDNNVKNYKETPDIPTEFIMLRNKEKDNN